LARRRPRTAQQPSRGSTVEPRFAAVDERLVAERKHDVEGAADLRTEAISRRDANHGDRHAFDVQRAADRVGGAAKAPLPEAVADHGDRAVWTAAALVVGVREGATEHRRHTERLEHRAARPDAVDEFGSA